MRWPGGNGKRGTQSHRCGVEATSAEQGRGQVNVSEGDTAVSVLLPRSGTGGV